MQRIMSRSILGMVFLLGLFMQTSVHAAAVHIATVDQVRLRFELVGFDSNTQTAIKTTTTAVAIGLQVTNDSPYTISTLSLTPKKGITNGYIQLTGPFVLGSADSFNTLMGTSFGGTWAPHQTIFIPIASGYTLKNVSSKQEIVALLEDLNVQVSDGTFSYNYDTEVQNVISTPGVGA